MKLKHGPHVGKEIEFASTSRTEETQKIADEFMFEIFDYEAGEYLISDESILSDFTDFFTKETTQIWRRIEDQYGINAEDVASEKLIDIFIEIQGRRNPQ
jgi:hypothetical protein